MNCKNDKKIYKSNRFENGFSLIELIISLLLTAFIFGIVLTAFTSALSTRSRESSKTDAITSAQAALNIISREVGNSGYGLGGNGIVRGTASDGNPESYTSRLHFRTNVSNNDLLTDDPGEDVTFYFDAASQSVVRYDKNSNTTSGVINRVSRIEFEYQDFPSQTLTSVPTEDTGKVTVKLTVSLANVSGQPINQQVTVKSDITLRNSVYMLGRY